MDNVAHSDLKMVINWSFLWTEKYLHASESVTVPEISFRVFGASQLRVRRTDVASLWNTTHLAIYKDFLIFILPQQLSAMQLIPESVVYCVSDMDLELKVQTKLIVFN